jgi:biopolymer transport protein ExbB/TolQ
LASKRLGPYPLSTFLIRPFSEKQCKVRLTVSNDILGNSLFILWYTISQIILAALLKHGSSREEIREAIEDTAHQEVAILEKNLPILATVGNIAPLLGLLGTVFGMIKGFQVISTIGIGNPEALAGAISEALLTTAFGLSVAIPTIVAYNYLVNRVERQIKEMEATSTEILELLSTTRVINEEDIKIDEILST